MNSGYIRDADGDPIVHYTRKDLQRTNMTGALLIGDYTGFDFSHAIMDKVKAHRVDFDGSYFVKTRCWNADFHHASLHLVNAAGADLRGCNLVEVDCSHSSFVGANFHGADVTGAIFTGTDFYGAIGLMQAIGIEPHIRVPEGEFVGYKIVFVGDQGPDQFALAKLIIPAEARRVRGVGSDIIRADRAMVWDIEGLVTGNPYMVARSWRYPSYLYRVGKLETPTRPFDSRITEHCGAGIHLHLDAAVAIAAFRLLQKGFTPCK